MGAGARVDLSMLRWKSLAVLVREIGPIKENV